MITGIIIISLIVAIIVLYNTIIGNLNRAKRAWSDVITYEKLKQDLIPQLTDVANNFKEFEADFIEKVTALRESIAVLDGDEIDVKALAKVESESKALFTSFRATAENYPELGGVDLIKTLMEELSDKNENVAAAITIFNRSVEHFNNSIEMVPYNIVNSLFAKKQALENFHQSGTVEDYDYKPNF
ncbi:LemA family protein [Glaciecola sp. MH2013]|uniref:LemA family protein n=1 Tax=Glaciecola sp. MH2013 TaxID=2785524 RepID=UPI0018A0015F|nr:LemA family protein [Glaciecola sp. MH2013]MBF7073113.1 LemA family protein [Glaciecola sp. MH2013]